MVAARIAVSNTLAKLSLNLGRVVLVKDLFLSIHHGSVHDLIDQPLQRASRGEVPVSGK